MNILSLVNAVGIDEERLVVHVVHLLAGKLHFRLQSDGGLFSPYMQCPYGQHQGNHQQMVYFILHRLIVEIFVAKIRGKQQTCLIYIK